MINLIPPTAQHQVKREYWIRVASVWMILIASGCMLVVVLNAPTYVLVHSLLKTYLQEYNQAHVQSESFKESEAAVRQSNEVAALLTHSDKMKQFSHVMSQLEQLTGNDVTIEQYRFTRDGNAVGLITVQGRAQSRLALSVFYEAIEADPHFEEVTLPLSNLAENENIPFTITMMPQAAQEKV